LAPALGLAPLVVPPELPQAASASTEAAAAAAAAGRARRRRLVRAPRAGMWASAGRGPRRGGGGVLGPPWGVGGPGASRGGRARGRGEPGGGRRGAGRPRQSVGASFSATTRLRMVPTFSTVTSIRSPGSSHTGGVRAKPTPPGVPVAMTSPGARWVKEEKN